MKTRSLHLVLLSAALTLALIACTGESGPPACTPLEGETGDPCDGDLTQVSGGGGGASRLIESEPWSIRFYLDGGYGTQKEGHVVVRGQYIPGTVRCANRNIDRVQPYLDFATDTYEWESGLGFVRCYADLRVADYIVGSGPSPLTVLAEFAAYQDTTLTAEQAEAERKATERVLITGGDTRRLRGVPSGGITGVEAIFFLGPALDASIEAWRPFTIWDLERRDDGTVIAVHPNRWYSQQKDDYESLYRSKAEMTLPAFKTAAQAGHQARLADYDGRIDEGADLPQLVTDANNLHSFHIDTGNVNHPDGPPETSLPPACGLAVPDQTDNPGLMLDCMALLGAKDTLRGTGTLNWSVDTTIEGWDGITTGGTPLRVTKLELDDEDLTGSIPAALAKLELTTLELAGNSLTGCIPIALEDVPTNDLADLGLPTCAG